MTIERVFSVHVRRREDDATGTARWVAWSGDERFEADGEEALRDRVRQHFLQRVSGDADVPPEALTARMRRTWRVAITDAQPAAAEGDGDMALFDLFD